MTTHAADAGAFTLKGRHVLACLLLFFGTVFSVNFYMARAAIATFSGLEAEKPYQAGLKYDDEIAAARAQESRRWSVAASVTETGDRAHLRVTQRDAASAPTSGLDLRATFLHPADRRRDVEVGLAPTGEGAYEALAPVAPGRWDLRIEASRGGALMFRSDHRIELR